MSQQYPLHPSPPSVASGDLRVNLLPHQSQALLWMIEHENPSLPRQPGDKAVHLWSRHKALNSGSEDVWFNDATKCSQTQAPVLGRGGILADGMGLGKTLTTLALILSTMADLPAEGYSNTTLIVCPLSLLGIWQKELSQHVAKNKLKCYTYYGKKRNVSTSTLQTYDIVLTTYQTVAGELPTSAHHRSPRQKKRQRIINLGGQLFDIKWKRVVGDEGHVLKNPNAKMSQAFTALEAERRWVCSGTPMVNSPKDLGSLLQSLHILSPLTDMQTFRAYITRHLERCDSSLPEAVRLLQRIVEELVLHRTKYTLDGQGKPLVSLPPKEQVRYNLVLDEATKTIYDKVKAELARRLKEGIGKENKAINLAGFTRLRQLSLSPELVPQSFFDQLFQPQVDILGPARAIGSFSDTNRMSLANKLANAIEDQEMCPVCFDILDDARITDCGHMFCHECITDIVLPLGACPIDNHLVTATSFLELPEDLKAFDALTVAAPATRSAKIVQVVKLLRDIPTGDKSLVFSQFTSFLDLIAAVLREEGILYCRFDGRMTAKEREAVITRYQTRITNFNRSKNPAVMLISLKSGAVGLNLTVANNVILCDPWWQNAIEAQAVDRVHRMGQKKTVRVFQLIAENTVEERVLLIQKRKEEMIANVFDESVFSQSKTARRQARLEELMEIFDIE